jgi:hypothetical protein
MLKKLLVTELEKAQEQCTEIRNPKSIKEIASTWFLFSVVLPEIQEFENIRAPCLNAGGSRWYQPRTILKKKSPQYKPSHRKKNTTCGTNTTNTQPDSTSSLADLGTAFKSFVDAFNGVVLRANEEP